MLGQLLSGRGTAGPVSGGGTLLSQEGRVLAPLPGEEMGGVRVCVRGFSFASSLWLLLASQEHRDWRGSVRNGIEA